MRLGKFDIPTPAVCASVIASEVNSMKARLNKALEQGVDAIELRLDKIQDPTGWQELLRDDIPIIVANRTKREGGYFKGEESERVAPLIEAIDKGVACVDIELSTPHEQLDKVLSAASDGDTNVLMSFHDFEKTPSVNDLIETSRQMEEFGCDLAKLIGFAKGARDVLRILDFLLQAREEVDVPVISFAMGETGRFARIAAPFFGSPIIYAAVDEKAAPGQFDVATIKGLLKKIDYLTQSKRLERSQV